VALAKQFVCVRVTNIQGVDLATFQFDYDVTWAGFLMNGEGRIYARVFGRDQTSAMSHLSMDALQSTMKAVLKLHEKEAKAKPEKRPPARWKMIDDNPVFKREVKGAACVHCHMVNEYDRLDAIEKKTYTKSLLWNYPPPENWGISLEAADTTKVKAVKKDSFADKAGMKAGDVLKSVGDVRILSQGDLFFAMQFSPDKGDVKVVVDRGGKDETLTLKIDGEWRKSDISWRQSIWRTEPRPGFFGKELPADEKKKAGLAADALALRIDGVQPGLPADKAGIKAGDVITAIGSYKKGMDGPHFQAYFRAELNPGDSVELTFLRGGKEQKATLAFPKP
jgi:predicted metalloprotease with PDZ domain